MISQGCTDSCADLGELWNVEMYLVEFFKHGIYLLALRQQREVTDENKVLDA